MRLENLNANGNGSDLNDDVDADGAFMLRGGISAALYLFIVEY